MLKRTKEIQGSTLRAHDGEIGRARDMYFDDASWAIRYLVADTGKWLSTRQVLISPHAVRGFDEDGKHVSVDLTKEQIEKSPSIDQDKPVSREFELEYHRYYYYPYYWQGPGMWGPLPRPGDSYGQVTGPQPQTWPPKEQQESGNPHLRSTRAVTGYDIQALDGKIGHVEDFVFDDEDWVIKYLVVDTLNWWPGKKVLVSPAWASTVDWHESKVQLNLDRQTIKAAPEYDMSKPISRDYETALFAYYRQQPYWSERKAA